MAKKKKRTISAKRAKEIKRVRQFIKRAEKRGYKFSDDFKASIATKNTRALQALTARKLYEKAQYEVLPGQYIPGLQGRYREREEAARKAKATRELKKPKQKPEVPTEEAPPIDKVIYQKVNELIDEFPSSEGAQYLKNLLESEVRNYGENLVIRGMAAAGESLVRIAQEIIYYELNSQQLHEALKAFSQIIRGGIALTKEESKQLNEVSESIGDES